MKRRKENNKMDAKDAIVILSDVIGNNHKECMRVLSRQNKQIRKMFMALVACGAYIYMTERQRRDMENTIDILAKEMKELKATKGE